MSIQAWPSKTGPYFVQFGATVVDLRQVAAIENFTGGSYELEGHVAITLHNGAVLKQVGESYFDDLWYLLSNLVTP